MILTLSSDQVSFIRAKVMIMSMDDPEGTFVECQCRNDTIADVQIANPGTYDLWLSDIDVHMRSTGMSVRLNGLLLPFEVVVSAADLDHGVKTVIVPSDGVFRITVIDSKRVPVPHYSLVAWVDERTTEIQMDESGACLLYGNPTRCHFMIDSGFGIIMEHL